ARVAVVALGQRYALVEAEEVAAAAEVLDETGHLLHHAAESGRGAVGGVGHELLEARPVDVDPPTILARPSRGTVTPCRQCRRRCRRRPLPLCVPGSPP